MLLPLGGALFASCASEIPRATLAEGCSINSDCDAPLVCAFKRCHNQCAASRDCPNGERCIQSDRPYRVCQQGDEQACAYNSECHQGQICGIDGQCRDRCLGDVDCIPGQVCVSGSCADTTELVDGGLTPSTDSGAPPDGQHCAYNSDCPQPLVCRGERCAKECILDVDCPQGTRCEGNLCMLPLPDGGPPDAEPDAPVDASTDGPPGYLEPCNLPSDCPPPLHCGFGGKCVFECNEDIDCALPGTCCVKHVCSIGPACTAGAGGGGAGGSGAGGGGVGGGLGVPCSANFDCDDGKFCNGPERCEAGHCAPALDTPCNSHSACIADFCAEGPPAVCSHQVQAGIDVDGDGHLSLGCVGGDDCNDADNTVYGGAKELCDNKDNDCDFKIDDYTTAPVGPTYAVGETFNAFGGYPARIESIGASGQWLALGTNINDTSLVAGKRFDANGNAEIEKSDLLPWFFFFNAVSSGTSVLALGQDNLSSQGVASVVHADLTKTDPVILSDSPVFNAHGAWTGGGWIVALSLGNTARYARITPGGAIDGLVFPVPTTVLGTILSNSFTYGVPSAGNAAVAYQLENGAIEIAVLNPNDGTPQTLIPLPWMGSPARYVIKGTPKGYSAFWDDGGVTKAAMFEIVGGQVIETIVTFPVWVAATAMTSDGAGLAFSILINAQPHYAYWRGGPQDPVEIVPMFVPGSAAHPAITYSSGRLTISYLDNAETLLSWRRAGCP